MQHVHTRMQNVMNADQSCSLKMCSRVRRSSFWTNTSVILKVIADAMNFVHWISVSSDIGVADR